MILKKIFKFTRKLENPKNPLLGPTLKALYSFGLWHKESKFRTVVYNLIHFSTLLFVLSEFVDLYTVRHDINKVINNMSLTILSLICFAKCYSYVMWQKHWQQLVQDISKEELLQIEFKDPLINKHIISYMNYTRKITYLYWVLVFVTNLLLILTPFLRYFSSKSYREEIFMEIEPLPQIMYSWFPFNNSKLPGYLFGIGIHIFMATQGSGVLAAYDMNAVAIMSYLKGHIIIIRENCSKLFDGASSTEMLLDKIKECHRHHNVLIKYVKQIFNLIFSIFPILILMPQAGKSLCSCFIVMNYKNFNDLLSPTMFLYVLMCAITICGSVVQFTSKEATPSQKFWVIQYTSALVAQLFLYCWHGNEVTHEANQIDQGIYDSDWWKGDVRVRKHLILLAGKFTQPFVLEAGPYTSLSVSTFVEIIKRSYSFFTLFSQMQVK